VQDFLEQQGVDLELITRVLGIVCTVGFKDNELPAPAPATGPTAVSRCLPLENAILQDADRFAALL
jgi:hypothetical protein